jgi:hypothetical protein
MINIQLIPTNGIRAVFMFNLWGRLYINDLRFTVGVWVLCFDLNSHDPLFQLLRIVQD